MPLRMSKELHARVTRAAIGAGTTTTQYIVSILADAVSRTIPQEEVLRFRDGERGQRRIHVALRLAPKLYRSIKSSALECRTSANRYAGFVLHRAPVDRIAQG